MQFHQRKFLKRLFANTTHKDSNGIKYFLVAVNPVFKTIPYRCKANNKTQGCNKLVYRKGRHSHFYLYQQNFSETNNTWKLSSSLLPTTGISKINVQYTIYRPNNYLRFLYFVSNHANDISIKQINNKPTLRP